MKHMLDAAAKAVSFIKNKCREDLDHDDLLSLALTRLVEVLGEAATKITPETQQKYNRIPWRQIIGTRNRLIHGYGDVNLDILWQIASRDLPLLIEQLQTAISQEENRA